MVTSSMDTRPREERELAELYRDFNETTKFPLFVSDVPLSPKENHRPPPRDASKGFITNPLRPNDDFVTEKQTHITKELAKYGFRGKKQPQTDFPPTYIRPYSQPPAAQSMVLYDMDEQDELYLDWLNSAHSDVQVTPEVFELVISTLEAEWHRLELKMSAVAGTSHENRDILTLDYNFEKYGSDDGTGGSGPLSEQRCAVCNDSECDNTNAIVFCDGCNIAVHQECYGIAFIPEGQWFCRRCMVSKGSPVTCTFCTSTTGAFKQLDNGLWSHVVCALWINEVYFANPIYLEPIEGVDAIPRNRWKLQCYICKQRVGACIQCTNRNCFQAYHVTCAKRAGLYMHMAKGVQGAITSKATLSSFCDKHTPPEWDRVSVLEGIHKTRMFYRDCQLLNQRNDRLASQRKRENRENSFKWKTEDNTPIAPQQFADKVRDLLSSLHIIHGSARNLRVGGEVKKDPGQLLSDVSTALCRYWCLKREAKRGASLVKQSVSEESLSAYSTGRVDASALMPNGNCGAPHASHPLAENLDFAKVLVRDIEKLSRLSALTRERQQLQRQSEEVSESMVTKAYFPGSALLKQEIANMPGFRHLAHQKINDETVANAMDAIIDEFDIHGDSSKVGENIQQLLNSVAHGEKPRQSTAKTARKLAEHWRSQNLHELLEVNSSQSSEIPFAIVKGLNFALKPHDPGSALKDADLSEVEDDPLGDANNRRLFQAFLNERVDTGF